ncbi:MAG TPA: hypothetical protein VEB43_04995 [Anaeromyxobacter sp.]|nr:hypothetical protein [Anaeromyxobacter sp.]
MKPFFESIEPEHTADVAAAVASLGAELADGTGQALGLEEIVGRFVEATPRLTPLERAELLRAVVEDVESGTVPRGPTSAAGRPASPGTRSTGSMPPRGGAVAPRPGAAPPRPGAAPPRPGAAAPTRPGPARSGGDTRGGRSTGFDWGRLASGFRTGLDVFQQAAQVVSQFTPRQAPPPGPAPGPGPEPAPGLAPEPAPPPAPDGGPAPYAAAPHAPYAPYAPPAAPPGGPAGALRTVLLQGLRSGQLLSLPGPVRPPSAAPPAPAPAPPLDATGMLGLILGNPQLQQALQWAAVLGPRAPRSVQLQIPSTTEPGATRDVGLPLGAVMNAIARLATEAVAELDEAAREDAPEVPEYLVGEDGEFVVDVASPEERARAATFMLRVAQEAERARRLDGVGAGDELDVWAREAGWTR